MTTRPELLDFPLVQDQERALRSAHARRVEELRATVGLCEQIEALEGDARFKLWIVNAAELLRRAEHELRTANDPFALARAQGKVLALASIVGLCKAAAGERKALAEQLVDEYDRASRAGVTGTGPIHPAQGLWSDHGRHEQQQQGRRDAGDGQGA